MTRIRLLALTLGLTLCACRASTTYHALGAVEDPPATEGQAGSRSGYEEVPEFGGDRNVGARLKEDDKVKETVFRTDGLQRTLKPYFDWKAALNENHDLALGADYTGLWFSASEDIGGDDSGESGNLRLYGSWTPVKTAAGGTGSLVFKVEDRHAYHDRPVSGLGFETGYVGLLGPPFNDSGTLLTNLYWMQKLNEGRTTVLGGVIDVTDYLDIYGLINPWTHFSNLLFSTGSGTIPAPNQGLGAAVGTFLGDSLYAVASVVDTNGDPTDLGDSVDSFFDEREYFKHIELGIVSSFEERYLNNSHITVWQADKRDAAGVDDGWGVNLSWAKLLDEAWMPFLRAGYSDDGGALLERSISAGIGHYMSRNGDLLGFGLNWGEPSSDFGAGLPDQYTAEFFYRIQLSQNFAITPDLQYVKDPALNPGEDSQWYLGLRARLSL